MVPIHPINEKAPSNGGRISPKNKETARGGGLLSGSLVDFAQTVIRTRHRFHEELKKLAACEFACIIVEGLMRVPTALEHTPTLSSTDSKSDRFERSDWSDMLALA